MSVFLQCLMLSMTLTVRPDGRIELNTFGNVQLVPLVATVYQIFKTNSPIFETRANHEVCARSRTIFRKYNEAKLSKNRLLLYETKGLTEPASTESQFEVRKRVERFNCNDVQRNSALICSARLQPLTDKLKLWYPYAISYGITKNPNLINNNESNRQLRDKYENHQFFSFLPCKDWRMLNEKCNRIFYYNDLLF